MTLGNFEGFFLIKIFVFWFYDLLVLVGWLKMLVCVWK